MKNRVISEVNALPPGLEIVYIAAEKGDASTLLASLRAGATVNFIHPQSTDSPLMIACRRGYSDIVKICLEYGARNDPHPEFGQTALHAAVASGRLSCVTILLEIAQESEADIVISNLTDQYGQTPLHTSCIIGSVPIAELLLHHGARLSSIDNYGQSPLHLCAGSGHTSVLAVLLDHGGDALIDLPDIYGNGPLHHAAYHGKLECAKLLLETAADVGARNAEGLTAYHLANLHGHQQISRLILDYRNGTADSYIMPPPPPSGRTSQIVNPPLPSDRFNLGYYSESAFVQPPDLRRRSTEPYAATAAFGMNPGMSLRGRAEVGSDLPRPHTVASPALHGSKSALAFKTKLGYSPRDARDSPASDSALLGDFRSHHFERGKKNESADIYGGYRVVSQLATPLTVREKRPVSASAVSNSKDERFVESGHKVFTGPKVIDSYSSIPRSASRTYSISSDSSADSPIKSQSPPAIHGESQRNLSTRKEPRQGEELGNEFFSQDYISNYENGSKTGYDSVDAGEGNAESGFADPLEVFTCEGMEWHVYTTEEGDTYYLDMVNAHSQWEDPRVYGLISYPQVSEEIEDGQDHQEQGVLSGVGSPSKLSDSGPPLSPALRSTRSAGSPGEALGSSPVRVLLPAFSGHEENSVLRTEEEEHHVSVQQSLWSESPARTKMGAKVAAALEVFEAKPPFEQSVMPPPPPLTKLSITVDSDGGSILPPPPPVADIIDVIPASSSLPIVGQVKESSSDNGDILKLSEQCVEMVRSGKSLQEVRTHLENLLCSTELITKVMAALDDCLLLDMKDDEGEGKENAKLANDCLNTPVNNKSAPPVSNFPKDPEMERKERLKTLQEEEPSLGKYVKMIMMGVVPMSVVSKMRLDGLPLALIHRMEVVLDLVPVTKSSNDSGASSTGNWQPMPEERLKNSIWAMTAMQEGEGFLAEQELQILDQLFRSQQQDLKQSHQLPSHGKIAALQKSVKEKMKLKVLEGKRAQNISIGLVPFRSFGSHADLLKAICSLNNLSGQLSVDNLENFRNLLPSEAERKQSFKLQQVSHPAEVFLQTVLLFYPELPIRLNTFIISLSFGNFAEATEKKIRVLMDAMNQVLSSTKLAKVLQRLLVVGRAMMQPTAGKSQSGKLRSAISDNKMTVLEQLLQISNTKAMDAKISLLDYLVKTLYDKAEESALGCIEDLSILTDPTTPLSSREILQEFTLLQKQVQDLEQELNRARSLTAAQETFSSPTAKSISDEYTVRLNDHLVNFRDRLSLLTKRKQLLLKKIGTLMEYFGEDPKEVDCSAVFTALKDFRRALSFSKEAVEWKFFRGGQQQQG